MNSIYKKGIAIVVMIAGLHTVYGQQTLSLDECLKLAIDNSIDVRMATNNSWLSQTRRAQAIMNFLPSLEARTNYDFYFGTFFDTNAARQVSATTRSANPNLRTSLTLFNGLSNHHTMKARWHQQEAATQNIHSQEVLVKANVLGAYLNVVLGIENVKISEQRVSLLQSQLEREEKRESVGVGTLEQVYNFRSQLANEKLNLVQAQNRLNADKLILLQTLGLQGAEQYQIAPYTFQPEELRRDVFGFDEIFNSTLAFSPQLKSAKSNLQASSFEAKMAKAGYMPTLTAFGLFGSNYSSNGALNPETGMLEPNAGFFDQLAYNEFKYINLSLSIPIFSNWRTKTAVQEAKVNYLNAELQLKQAELETFHAVRKVYEDLQAAHSTYEAALDNLDALNQSYLFAKTRYEQGNTDFFTYLESLNNKNRAELELVNARYSIVFRKKILQLYQGKLD